VICLRKMCQLILTISEIIQISPSSREKAKSFLNSIFDYAIQHFYAKQNIARKFSIQQLKKEMPYDISFL
ncbi:hypothetical protein, partial [Anaerostipes hominis (ex Lee et al. 2021)]|uniref:hypothetical protein n=1 Tax=Anaerostipes hominis (ex Lee et al. 2021) TaxID=2025494 RepID=UPI0022E67170